MSFDEVVGEPIRSLFLGLGYTEVAGVKRSRSKTARFYDKLPVVNISNVNNLVRRYDLEKIYKSIEIGYKKGVGSESESGIDDPQTKRFYNTDFFPSEVKKQFFANGWRQALRSSGAGEIELN